MIFVIISRRIQYFFLLAISAIFRFIFNSGKKNDAEAAQNCVKNRTKNLANVADKENGTHIREDEEQNQGLDSCQFLGNHMNTQSAHRSSAFLTVDLEIEGKQFGHINIPQSPNNDA